MLPTFLVIGAQKAGTTSLHRYLSQHPDVFVAEKKELSFWTDLEYHRGLGWYEEQFAPGAGYLALGDVSPQYTAYPWLTDVPERVSKFLPGVRLVYLMRNPVERSISNYRYHVALGIEKGRPEEGIFHGNPVQYIDRGKYMMQLDRWLPNIDRSDLLCLTSEDLRADHFGTMAKIWAHIGVDPDAPLKPKPEERNRTEDVIVETALSEGLKNFGPWKAIRRMVPGRVRHVVWKRFGTGQIPMTEEQLNPSQELLDKIHAELRPDLVRLREFLGGDFHCWGLLDD